MMTHHAPHTPQAYHPRMSTYWWLERWPYLRFILREISSVFVAWFACLTMMQAWALIGGPAEYQRFQLWLEHPLLISLNAVSLFFVLFHAITWFNLAPKAMAIRLRGKRVPDLLIAGPNYAVWLVVSLALAWIFLRG